MRMRIQHPWRDVKNDVKEIIQSETVTTETFFYITPINRILQNKMISNSPVLGPS